ADEDHQHRLRYELHDDRSRCCAHGFADTNLARTFAYRDQHYVHHAETSQEQCCDPHCAEKVLHAISHLLEGLSFLDRVPYGSSLFVGRIEVMDFPQHSTRFRFARLVLTHRLRHHQHLIEGMRCCWRFVGEVALHHRKRYEQFVDIKAIVTRILIFLFADANDRERKSAYLDRLAQRWPVSEQLFLGLRAKHDNSPRIALVFPGVEAAIGDVDAAHVAERRQRSRHYQACGVESAYDTNVFLLDLRQRVLAVGGVTFDQSSISILVAHFAAGPQSTGLGAGRPGEDDHDVFTERS